MKVTMFSNFLTHHQIPFCDAMYKRIGDDFTFVATKPMTQERVANGWTVEIQHPYELQSYASHESKIKAQALADESDVVIIGSAPLSLVRKRIKRNKVTCHYMERYFKHQMSWTRIPRVFYSMFEKHYRFRKKRTYMLCAGAYTSLDFSHFNLYKNKAFKWGYFPECIAYAPEDILRKPRKTVQLLWCGRFLDWKHPDMVIALAKELLSAGYDFHLTMIGSGPMEVFLKKMIAENKLERIVTLLPSIEHNAVRKHMLQSDIYLATSDYYEGWGAVINEAMNSGCSVVASHAMGSVPYLIKHGENGMIFRSGNFDELKTIVEDLIKDHNKRCLIGSNAYQTIIKQWNADIASENFLDLAHGLIVNRPIEILEGPCSPAEIINDHRALWRNR